MDRSRATAATPVVDGARSLAHRRLVHVDPARACSGPAEWPDGGATAQLADVPKAASATGPCATCRPTRRCAARLAAAPWPEVSFNFLGRLGDGPADPLAERTGPARASADERAHLIELNGAITGGRLRFDVFFSSAIHTEATARALAEELADELRVLATAVAAAGVPSHDLETVLRRVRATQP